LQVSLIAKLYTPNYHEDFVVEQATLQCCSLYEITRITAGPSLSVA